MFQSTLPVAGERCPLLNSANLVSSSVSIHAPRCRGAMRAPKKVTASIPSFQSTLPVAGERCIFTPAIAEWNKSFNPRSPLPGSDALSGSVGTSRTSCFNPRSPLPGSDALNQSRVLGDKPVSIHAPRCRGAMHRGVTDRRDGQPVSIHAPRCRGAMRWSR